MLRLLRVLAVGLIALTLNSHAAGLDEVLGKKPARPGDFLDVDQAFQFSAEVVDRTVYARFTIAPGYYLYQHRFQFHAQGAPLGQPAYPGGEAHVDDYFGKVTIYRQQVEIPVPVTGAGSDLELTVSYQGCADKGLCYPPTEKTVHLTLGRAASDAPPPAQPESAAVPRPDPRPADSAPLSEETRLARLLAGASLPVAIGFFLLLGLGLAFTPCVFPMLPILSSLVAGQAGRPNSAGRSFTLSFAYVQGMALSFALLGIAAAMAGRGLAGLFQSPWIIGAVCLLFVLLALSMFGLYELRLPSVLTTRAAELSNRQKSGTYLGAVLMGVLSTLVVSPCVTAPLAGAVLYVAQTGDKLLGGLALYALALGMGLPLLLIGTAGGKLLPRAGAWMDGIKAAFGVGLLGIALYLGGRFLPGSVALLLWAALCIVSSVYLGAFARDRESKWTPLRQGLGLLLFVIGTAQAVGAAMGNSDPLAPLSGLSLGAPAQAAKADPYASFLRIKTVEDLERELAAAKAAGKPVLVDFYADWCVACHEFASKTFPDPAVKALMAQAVLLQADATAYDAEDQRLMQAHAVLGLPTLLIYGRDGREFTESRVTGFMPAEAFAAHLRQLWTP